MDCLNYGVGGYGLDQVYLLFERTHRQFDPAQSIFLIGVTDDELLRTLLRVRQCAKPYFTVNNSTATLQTGHIDVTDPQRYFTRYRPKFRLFALNLLVHEIKPLNRALMRPRERARDARLKKIVSMLVEKFAQSGAQLRFVIFSDWRNNLIKSELARQNIPTIAVDEFLSKRRVGGNISPGELDVTGHPSTALNEVIADYILSQLKKT